MTTDTPERVPNPEWWHDFFTQGFGPLQIAGARDELIAQDTDLVLKVLGLGPGNSVLDAPCGTGRISLELAARGLEVTGVDFNPDAVRTARSRADERGLTLDLRVEDIRNMAFRAEFDAVVCFWGSFGYFDEAGDLLFARGAARALAPGGKFLIETHSLESLLPRYAPRTWSTHTVEGSEVRILQERTFDLATGRLNEIWIFQSRGEERSFETSVKIYSYRDLCALLRQVGFQAFSAFDSSGQPFTVGADRLCLIATA